LRFDPLGLAEAQRALPGSGFSGQLEIWSGKNGWCRRSWTITRWRGR